MPDPILDDLRALDPYAETAGRDAYTIGYDLGWDASQLDDEDGSVDWWPAFVALRKGIEARVPVIAERLMAGYSAGYDDSYAWGQLPLVMEDDRD